MKQNKISRTEAVTLIKSSGGKFFSVSFKKGDNSERTFNCIYKGQTNLGYLLVNVKNEGIKNLNTRTLTFLKINKNSFKIV